MVDLEKAGIRAIQVDEAAIREGVRGPHQSYYLFLFCWNRRMAVPGGTFFGEWESCRKYPPGHAPQPNLGHMISRCRDIARIVNKKPSNGVIPLAGTKHAELGAGT